MLQHRSQINPPSQTFQDAFRDVRSLALAGILIAIGVVLTFLRVFITQSLAISFAFLPLATGSMLFGPLMGGAIGMLTDLVGYAVRPAGPFFPGFTLSACLTGIIYGIMLYRKPLHPVRVFLAGVLNTLVVNLLLNSLWLSILYGNAFIVLLSGRLLKNLLLLPVETAMLYLILRTAARLRIRPPRQPAS